MSEDTEILMCEFQPPGLLSALLIKPYSKTPDLTTSYPLTEKLRFIVKSFLSLLYIESLARISIQMKDILEKNPQYKVAKKRHIFYPIKYKWIIKYVRKMIIMKERPIKKKLTPEEME